MVDLGGLLVDPDKQTPSADSCTVVVVPVTTIRSDAAGVVICTVRSLRTVVVPVQRQLVL